MKDDDDSRLRRGSNPAHVVPVPGDGLREHTRLRRHMGLLRTRGTTTLHSLALSSCLFQIVSLLVS